MRVIWEVSVVWSLASDGISLAAVSTTIHGRRRRVLFGDDAKAKLISLLSICARNDNDRR